MNLASISENKDKEKRIAVTPEIAKKYISLGFNLSLPNNYGSHLGFSDDQYKSLGVNFFQNEEEIIKI
jgi:NAD(P) transhydrogenase subunit alpha